MSIAIIILGIILSIVSLFLVYRIRRTNMELRGKITTSFEDESDDDVFSEILKRHLEANLKQTEYKVYNILDNNLEHQLTTIFRDNYFSILAHHRYFDTPLELHKTLYKTQLSESVIKNLFLDKKDTKNIAAFYVGVFAVITIYITWLENEDEESTKDSSRNTDLDLFFANYHLHFKSHKGHINNIYIDQK